VIAFGHGSVWIGDTAAATVTRYDPETLSPEPPIEVPQGVDAIVIGDRVWVLSQSTDVLTPIDPSSGQPGTSVPVGEDPTGLTTGGGAVWVGDEDGMIRRVDENTREVTEIPFGSEIRALAYDDETDSLWVDVAAARSECPRMPRSPVPERGPGFGLAAALRRATGDAGSTYSVEPASSTGGVSGGMTPAPCSNTTSPSRTSTMIVSPARNSL
jgi:hypothetical protein